MNKLTASLSLSAALMLGVANLAAPAAFAQEKEEKGPAMKESSPDKGPSRAQEGNPSKAESPDRNSDKAEGPKNKASENRGDQEKSKSASEQRDRNDKSASDKGSSKSKSADRQDDNSSNKQSENKSDQPAQKADTAPAKKSDDTADSKKPEDGNRNAGKAGDEPNRSAADTAKADKAKTADLSGDKKDRVKTSFKSENVKKITNVNIEISVGRRLPRDWEYNSVPTAVIEIVPEYRGYRYAYIEDRYVIVDPNTYEVVYVIEDSGSGSASVGRSTGESGSARCSTELTFSREDRTFIFEKVRSHSASIKIGNLEIGTTLPQDSRVEVFPSEVTTRVTKLDSCRYVVIDDKVAVVDPNDDRIVAIIED